MEPREYNHAIELLKLEREPALIIPNETIAQACLEALDALRRSSPFEGISTADLEPPTIRPRIPSTLSDSTLSDIDLRANERTLKPKRKLSHPGRDTKKAKTSAPTARVTPVDADNAYISDSTSRSGRFSSWKPSSHGGGRGTSELVIRDNRSARPIGHLIKFTDMGPPRRGQVDIRLAGLGDSKAAPIELDSDSITESEAHERGGSDEDEEDRSDQGFDEDRSDDVLEGASDAQDYEHSATDVRGSSPDIY